MELIQSGKLVYIVAILNFISIFYVLNNLVFIELLYQRSRAACLSRKSLEYDGIELKNGRGSFFSFLSYMKERNSLKFSCLLLLLKMSIFINQVINQCTSTGLQSTEKC